MAFISAPMMEEVLNMPEEDDIAPFTVIGGYLGYVLGDTIDFYTR